MLPIIFLLVAISAEEARREPIQILAVHRYVSTRHGPLTTRQQDIRNVAYALKEAEPSAVRLAGTMMADRIELSGRPVVLVPVPDSRGQTSVNQALCEQVALRINQYSRPGPPIARVLSLLSRSHPVRSSRAAHVADEPSPSVAEHAMVGRPELLGPDEVVYLVDNVATTGRTLLAANNALGGRGIGLVWAVNLPDPIEASSAMTKTR